MNVFDINFTRIRVVKCHHVKWQSQLRHGTDLAQFFAKEATLRKIEKLEASREVLRLAYSLIGKGFIGSFLDLEEIKRQIPSTSKSKGHQLILHTAHFIDLSPLLVLLRNLARTWRTRKM